MPRKVEPGGRWDGDWGVMAESATLDAANGIKIEKDHYPSSCQEVHDGGEDNVFEGLAESLKEIPLAEGRFRNNSAEREEGEEGEERTPDRLSVSSSTGKLPRRVSFADEIGEELSTCIFFEEKTDFSLGGGNNDLDKNKFVAFVFGDSDEEDENAIKGNESHFVVRAEFEQPVADFASFSQRLYGTNVSLENLLSGEGKVYGTIKGLDKGPGSTAKVRLTWDNWHNFTDVVASEAGGTVAFGQRTFTFSFPIPSHVTKGTRLQFAVCMTSQHNEEFWDNNNGLNYQALADISD